MLYDYGNSVSSLSRYTDLKLNIGLDLGSDTLKIAFAHYGKDGQLKYGKICESLKKTQIAIPALAYYDQDLCEWIFGNDIDSRSSESFITVVKIKSLISLLSKKQNKKVAKKNEEYYLSGNDFPKFFFPVRRKMLDNFADMVNKDATFKVKNTTPKDVCEQFFSYVKKLVDGATEKLSASLGTTFSGYNISLVHASSVGESYINELSRIVKKAFGVAPNKILSSNKALAIYAKERNAVKNDESFLVFDMGEEDISVVRANCVKGKIAIDGVDGHNEPLSIGGIDVDEAIVNHIEKIIDDREIPGADSVGGTDRIVENGTYSKRYLFMKDVKRAKVILSKPSSNDNVFKDGIPITIHKECVIQRVLTKEEVEKCIGVKDGNGVAKKIVDYIVSEIKRSLNKGIKNIFISGGLTETYSLLDYIEKTINTLCPEITVNSFDDFKTAGSASDILSYEDSVFAPAVGGAIVSLKDINIATITSLTYAAWGMNNRIGKKVLAILVERGTEIDPENGSEFFYGFNVGGYGVRQGEELFSTIITKADIERGRLSCVLNGEMIVGDQGTAERRLAEKETDLKTVSGGKNGEIRFMYNGKQVYVCDRNINFHEGIRVDKNGRATPYLKNTTPRREYVYIMDVNSSGNAAEWTKKTVSAADIELVFAGGVEAFSVANE